MGYEKKVMIKIIKDTYGGTVTGTMPLLFGGGLLNAANLA